ncbi:MAG: HDIG domain-containing protein [Bacteroidales bacterium]|nr:HDIG domain-containing protein [Bacteroidales bacterium]
MIKNITQKIKSYTLIFSWIFIFLLTAVLLFLILPGEPKFKYEYQKGFPWKHENLVAPFDFAILKTYNEIEKEKSEQLNAIAPYFTVDTVIVAQKLAMMESDWHNLPGAGQANTEVLNFLKTSLKELYGKGILQRSPETYKELEGKNEIKKRTGNRVEKISINDLLSEKTAYTLFVNILKKTSGIYSGAENEIKRLTPKNYIAANLEFDELTTIKEIKSATSAISSTRGMIKTGERIVLEGEIIDDAKFQILESLKASYEKEFIRGINSSFNSVGRAVLVSVFVILLFLFLYIFKKEILRQFRKLSFLLLFLVSMVLISKYIESFPNLHIYIIPFAIFPIIIRTFYDSRTAIFTLTIATLITGFFAPNNYEFVLMQITAGITAVFSLSKMHRRVHLVMAAIWVFLTYLIVFIALELIYEGNLFSANFKTLQWFGLSSLLVLLVYPLVFIFEKIFGFVSDVTLIELSDTNQPLLRKLAEKAPGTFQHSIQIANLAEEIILKIGGNPFKVRAGALYHDIGKISAPAFFIENQDAGINPHDNISYLKSAEIIIDHVNKGVKLAKKHNLPDSLIEFIATHHGTTKAKYFYLKYQQENPSEKTDESSFNYPGPLPVSKEAAVVMLVDGVEAASRSLKEKTPQKFKELIDDIIDQKIRDKQLEQSDLTFHDIKIIKEILLNKLMNIFHIRIEYPKEKVE